MAITVTREVEIRKLPPGVIISLSQILESGEGWKRLMSVIPVECKEGNPPKYNVDHMRLIEGAGKCQERYCSDILFEEWGTSGRCRPTVYDLLKFLNNAELYRAADYVAVELLGENPLPRPEIKPLPSHQSNNAKLVKSQVESKVESKLEAQVKQLLYSDLEKVTDGWNEERVVGRGAWGCVYKAHHPSFGFIAIKRLHLASIVPVVGDTKKQFQNEIEVLSKVSHTNLLPLHGYSEDGPSFCLAYQFMEHGSLLDKLNKKKNHNPLLWDTRMKIALGTAKGLAHLHDAFSVPLVHRDVKSANILLDNNLVPKLGDFGLVRMGRARNHTQTTAVTSNVIGTSAYMAPEAHRGDVSPQMDIFSFGVVLLELITGLPPFEETRNGRDLMTFVENEDDQLTLVDKEAGWPKDIDSNVLEVAWNCLAFKKNERPTISQVIDKLNFLLN